MNFWKEIPCNFEDIKLYIKLETLEEAEEHDGRQQNAEPIVFVWSQIGGNQVLNFGISMIKQVKNMVQHVFQLSLLKHGWCNLCNIPEIHTLYPKAKLWNQLIHSFSGMLNSEI